MKGTKLGKGRSEGYIQKASDATEQHIIRVEVQNEAYLTEVMCEDDDEEEVFPQVVCNRTKTGRTAPCTKETQKLEKEKTNRLLF